MFKGDRPDHPIWEYFLRVKVDGKVTIPCRLSYTTKPQTVRETNIKYYFTFMFVIYKYTTSDIMIIHN